MMARKKFWTRTRGIVAGVAAALGVTGASVWGALVTVGRQATDNYVAGVVGQRYTILHSNVEKRVERLEKRDSCVTYDIRYTRYLLEQVVNSDKRQAAINKMRADEEWRVK